MNGDPVEKPAMIFSFCILPVWIALAAINGVNYFTGESGSFSLLAGLLSIFFIGRNVAKIVTYFTQ